MNKILLHIPHSSTNIPLRDGYLVPDAELKNEMLKLTDWHTDDLFQHEEAVQIIAPFSRIFCDVERFSEDKDEIMANFGMGMLYTAFDDGKILRKIDTALRNKIYKQFYLDHHNKLLSKTEESLKNLEKFLIIDCHSFSDIPFDRDLNKTLPRPDIDIGTDEFHTPEDLLKITEQYFKKAGFSCKVNSPYAGTIVPHKYYKKDKRVQSVMIEVNRNLYLESGSNIKNKNYGEIKKILNGFIEHMLNFTV